MHHGDTSLNVCGARRARARVLYIFYYILHIKKNGDCGSKWWKEGIDTGQMKKNK